MLLWTGYDPVPVRKQPGQELLVLQLQARLLQLLEPGSTLYPVDSELDLKWPIESVDRAVPDERPEFRQQREQLFTGAGTSCVLRVELQRGYPSSPAADACFGNLPNLG
jgi:hypothetical protein